MSHAERMKEQIRNLEALIRAEKSKPESIQNKRQIEIWENQITGLKGQLNG